MEVEIRARSRKRKISLMMGNQAQGEVSKVYKGRFAMFSLGQDGVIRPR